MNKLPSELRLVVSRHIAGDNWELDPLMELIEQEIEARERADTSAITSSTSRDYRRSIPSTTATFVVGSQRVNCCYCRESHFPSACKSVTDVETRKQVLRREGRCSYILKMILNFGVLCWKRLMLSIFSCVIIYIYIYIYIYYINIYIYI